MIAEERWDGIIRLLDEKGSVTVTELTELLHTSESTIRRDLAQLDRMNRLVRVHGGAVKPESLTSYVPDDISMHERYHLHSAEKEAIAAYASGLLRENDFVYIDAGTTTERLVEAVKPGPVYVTNSIGHAMKLLHKGCRVILPGGEIKPVTEALVGADTVDAVRRFHFTAGFWGTNGVSDRTGFTTPDPDEAAVKRTTMEHTERRYVLCDHSKFQIVSPVSFAAFPFAEIITDSGVDSRFRKYGNIHIV